MRALISSVVWWYQAHSARAKDDNTQYYEHDGRLFSLRLAGLVQTCGRTTRQRVHNRASLLARMVYIESNQLGTPDSPHAAMRSNTASRSNESCRLVTERPTSQCVDIESRHRRCDNRCHCQALMTHASGRQRWSVGLECCHNHCE